MHATDAFENWMTSFSRQISGIEIEKNSLKPNLTDNPIGFQQMQIFCIMLAQPIG